MTIKAVLFDMDGTILDSEDAHTKSVQDTVREELGIELPKEEIEKYVGILYEKKLEIMLKERGIDADFSNLAETARSKSPENCKLIEPAKGAEKVIQKMKKIFKIALVTATRREDAELFLDKVDFKKYFKIRVTSDDVKNDKPSPDPYLLGAQKLRIKPKECIAIEDSAAGVQSAKNAGMSCIVIRHKYNKSQDFSMADVVVNDIREISVEMVKNLG